VRQARATRSRALRAASVALAGVLAAAPAAGDRVYPKKGPPVRGVVTRADTELVVNKYRATSPAMTYGVVRLPLSEVRRVDDEVNVVETVRRRREELAAADAAGRVGLAKYALAQKAVREANRVLEEALAIEPENADALAMYGGKEKFEAAKRGNPALDADLKKALDALLGVSDGRARAEEAKKIEAARGFPARPEVVERARRSGAEPRGLRQDVPVRLRADRFPGAVCTVYVPPAYDAEGDELPRGKR